MNFEQINENIFRQHSRIRWFDRTGILPLDDNRNAEITLSTDGIVNNYSKYTIKIIHKQNGVIAVKEFLFRDYLQDRVDNRDDYKGSCHLWFDEQKNGWHWYIAIPSDKTIIRFANMIMYYINFYM